MKSRAQEPIDAVVVPLDELCEMAGESPVLDMGTYLYLHYASQGRGTFTIRLETLVREAKCSAGEMLAVLERLTEATMLDATINVEVELLDPKNQLLMAGLDLDLLGSPDINASGRQRISAATRALWNQLVIYYGNRCILCGAKEVTLDHIIPTSEGGSDEIENLQPLCRSCNSRKGTSAVDYRHNPDLAISAARFAVEDLAKGVSQDNVNLSLRDRAAMAADFEPNDLPPYDGPIPD